MQDVQGAQPVWEGGTYGQEVKACFDIIRSHAEARAVLLSGVYAVDMAGDFAFILSVMRIRMYFPVKVKYVCRKKRRFRSLE